MGNVNVAVNGTFANKKYQGETERAKQAKTGDNGMASGGLWRRLLSLMPSLATATKGACLDLFAKLPAN